MGFKAINQDGDAVYSFSMSNTDWNTFKSNHKSNYKMPCCDAVAIPKTNKFGTQFFSHKSNSCGSGESAQHQLIKYLILRSLHENGWNADTEVRFNNGDELFISDVYAVNGGRKLAFEVQWSRIDEDELNRRHDKYTRAGIKCIWLCRHKTCGDSFNRPVFHFGLLPDGSISIGGLLDAESNSKFAVSVDYPISLITQKKINKVSRIAKFYAKLEYEKRKCLSCGNHTAKPIRNLLFININGKTNRFNDHGCLVVNGSEISGIDNIKISKSNENECAYCEESRMSGGYSLVVSEDSFGAAIGNRGLYVDCWADIS